MSFSESVPIGWPILPLLFSSHLYGLELQEYIFQDGNWRSSGWEVSQSQMCIEISTWSFRRWCCLLFTLQIVVRTWSATWEFTAPRRRCRSSSATFACRTLRYTTPWRPCRCQTGLHCNSPTAGQWLGPIHVGFRAHVKIVSYRIVSCVTDRTRTTQKTVEVTYFYIEQRL